MENIKEKMLVDGLPIPPRLTALIELGLWPRNKAEERKQNIKSLVQAERIHLFAPEEDRIYFLSPPFHTVKRLLSRKEHEGFWSRFGALESLEPELSIEIGSFGPGSDSPILLDYRQDRSNPAIIKLTWRKGQGLPNIWVRCADNFEDFADMVELDRHEPCAPS